MVERTEVAAFRVPKGTVGRLKMLAHRLSLERGVDVSWCSLLREYVEKNLSDQGSRTQILTEVSAFQSNFTRESEQ
jgi:hypothetical protein